MDAIARIRDIAETCRELEHRYATEPLDMDPVELSADFQTLAAQLAALAEAILETH
jgi:hypothetical protein